MSDDRPRPKYGEYGPVPPVAVAPATPATPDAARPRTGDIVLTTLLLLLGVLDVVGGFPQFADLAGTLRQTYAAQHFPAFTSDALANDFGFAINIARVVVLVVVVAGSLLRIRLRRRAFWVPLAGAAVSAIIVIGCVLAVILMDPAFAQYVSTQTPTG